MDRVSGKTKVIGLIGNPIQHSSSPALQNTFFTKNGDDLIYLCFEIAATKEALKESLEGMKALGIKAANITYPFKEVILDFLDYSSKTVEILGACNVITIDSLGKIHGYNTDGAGFVNSLDFLNVNYKEKKVVLYGLGGAGKSIAIQLALAGVGELCICQRTESKYNSINKTIDKMFPNVQVRRIKGDENELREELKDSSLLINATTLGYKGFEEKSIIYDVNTLNPNVFVYDIIYAPAKTKLLHLAESANCQYSNGFSMMIFQGALAYKHFTGKEIPLKYVKDVLEEYKNR